MEIYNCYTCNASSDTFVLFNSKSSLANTTVELLTRDLILQSGEILKVQAATANRLHVVASIQELSKTRITTSAITQDIVEITNNWYYKLWESLETSQKN